MADRSRRATRSPGRNLGRAQICAGWGARMRRCFSGRAPTGAMGVGAELPARMHSGTFRAQLPRAGRPGRLQPRCPAGVAREHRIAYDHLARGILHFATDARGFEALARSAEAVRALGIERDVKSALECLRARAGAEGLRDPVAGGTTTPTDESADACRFKQELARLAAERGVAFRFGASLRP